MAVSSSKNIGLWRPLGLITALLVMAGCGGSGPGSEGEAGAVKQIVGSVVYRERMLLPPGSELATY